MYFARRNIMAIGVLLTLGAAPLAVYAQASYYFSLPVQSLVDSLRAVGSRGRVNVTFEPTAVRDRMAPALRGSYSVQQALEHLISGSGLVLRTTEHGSFLVEAESATNTVAPPGKASTKSFDFNIQSQNLSNTLRAIARTTGQRIDFDTAVISKKKADPVSGRLTVIDALQRALVGTGLHAAVTSSGTVTVLPGPENVEQMPDVMVTATIQGLSATRMPTVLKEIPQSVSVISQKTLEQQNDFGLSLDSCG